MPTQTAIARPHFGSIEHLRQAPSVMARVAGNQERFLRQKTRQVVDRAKELAPSIKQVSVQAAESSAVAYVFGYASGRWPEKLTALPVPAEVMVGVASHLVGFFGPPGASPHMHAVGLGSLNSFFHSLGRGKGRVAKGGTAGAVGESTGGGALSDEELANISRRI